MDRAGAASMVREMAGYHGALWEDPRLDGEWTDLRDSYDRQRNFNVKTRFDAGAMAGMRLAREEIPNALHRRRPELRAALMRSLEINAGLPRTLLHHAMIRRTAQAILGLDSLDSLCYERV